MIIAKMVIMLMIRCETIAACVVVVVWAIVAYGRRDMFMSNEFCMSIYEAWIKINILMDNRKE